MKRLFFIISTCFLIYGQAQAVPISFFEGLDTVLLPEYDFLNPVYGQLLALKQDLIENFFVSGDKNHPLTKLCRQLFFRREGDGFFAPTKKAEYVSTYLTPYDFGWVIALVLFKPDVFSNAGLYSDCEKNEKADKDVCLFLKEIKDQQQKKQQEEEEQQKKQQEEKKAKNLFKPSAVFKFINLIVEARKLAESQLYNSAIPVHILLAAACMKATEKIDLLEIMRGLFEHTPAEKAVFKEDKKALFSAKNNEKKLFLEKIYEEKRAFADFKDLAENRVSIAPSPYTFLLQLLTFSGFEAVQMLTIRESSDCTESGLVEFTRFLLDREGDLDVALLPKDLQKHPFVVDFVKQFNGKSLNDMVARTWFFDALSGKPKLVYVKNQNYEIKALPENILQGLNLIFGTNAKEWKELGPLLSTEDRIVSFELRDSRDPTAGTIVLGITKQGSTRTDELDVSPGHTEVKRTVDTRIVAETERLIKKLFGNEAIDSYPFCIFKNQNSLLEIINKKNQVDNLLTHALKTTGFGFFCKLLIDPSMVFLVKKLFDPADVVPVIAAAGSSVSEIVFERYQEIPFSAYAARFPVVILKDAFLGPQYQENVLKFLKFLQTQKTLESNADGVIRVLMGRYEIRGDIERFKYGAFEKLLMKIAVQYPELFSSKVHETLWDRGNWDDLDKYLAFEVFLVGQKKDFFSASKKGTLHEFVLQKEFKSPVLEAEALSKIQAFGAAVLLENKALLPTMEQSVLEKLPYTFDSLIADKKIKEVLVENSNKIASDKRRILLIFSLLALERLVRQQNFQLKKEPHLLENAFRYFDYYSYAFLHGLIDFNKKYPNELWSTMVNENQTFAELLASKPFTANKLQGFIKGGLAIPQDIQDAQKATPEERKKLLAGYRPSSEALTDLVYALASF